VRSVDKNIGKVALQGNGALLVLRIKWERNLYECFIDIRNMSSPVQSQLQFRLLGSKLSGRNQLDQTVVRALPKHLARDCYGII
jgi:hypothetical protein